MEEELTRLKERVYALPPHMQHRLAEMIAANVGYELVSEAAAWGDSTASDAAGIITDACQILDVVRREWAADGQWSAWDQQVRERCTLWLRGYYSRPTLKES